MFNASDIICRNFPDRGSAFYWMSFKKSADQDRSDAIFLDKWTENGSIDEPMNRMPSE
jgi:hypothetical protein